MIAVFAMMLMTGAPVATPSVSLRAPVAQASAPRPRLHQPVRRYEVLGDIPATLREPTLCAAHMELLIEKVSAVGEDVQAPVLLIQEYWQTRLPDPDGDSAISDDIFSRLKTTLDASARICASFRAVSPRLPLPARWTRRTHL